MKKNVTYVDAAKFETITNELGLTLTPQAGFVKVSAAKGRNLYVARTKTVGRVDISGFEVQGEGITNLGGAAFGNVKQQLDFSLTEEAILANFRRVCEHMKSLPAVERVSAAKEAKPKNEVKGWSPAVAPPATPADKAAKLAKLEEVAARMGKTVSKKTKQELTDSSSPQA